MNNVILVGNLGSDAELKYTQNQTPVANFSLATTKKWGDKDNKKEKTIWHTVNVWGKYAENIYQYLKKGQKVAISGEIDENKWEDKDGNKRSRIIIIAQEIEFMGSLNKDSQGKNNNFAEDNIPF